jgi:glutathione S-transferase
LDALLLYDHPESICSQMARLAIVEKGLSFTTRTIDILVTGEQFEPWYTALNPKAVVPTLAVGKEVVTDTIRIVQRVDHDFSGPALTPSEPGEADAMREWLSSIMAVHYGVLLYCRKLDGNRRSPMMISRLQHLRELREKHPENTAIVAERIAGNLRLQRTLASPERVREVVDTVRALVESFEQPLARHEFLVNSNYTLADCFCTAALARLDLHGYAHWWREGALPSVERYYTQMVERPSFAEAGVVNREWPSDAE